MAAAPAGAAHGRLAAAPPAMADHHAEAEMRIRARSQALLLRMSSHQAKIQAHVGAAESLSVVAKSANTLAARRAAELDRVRDVFAAASRRR